MSEKEYVYLTHDALTRGIKRVEVDHRFSTETYVSVIGEGSGRSFKLGLDAHRTFGKALTRAEEMRVRRLQQFKSQVLRLSALSFSMPTA